MLLLPKLVGLALIVLINSDVFPLNLQPPKVVVEYGAAASVNCSTTIDLMGMGWEASQGPVDIMQHKVYLHVIIYKTPESVSISIVGHTGPMIESGQYELQCDIQNVAPVEFLTVSWFKGDTVVENITITDHIKTPVNRSSTLQISPSRADDGAHYRCKAELHLGPEGPQPPPTVTSDPLNITVH
ncbi:hypothetical protein SRHO_G00013000 [Serrasalmus rhombeus]